MIPKIWFSYDTMTLHTEYQFEGVFKSASLLRVITHYTHTFIFHAPRLPQNFHGEMIDIIKADAHALAFLEI